MPRAVGGSNPSLNIPIECVDVQMAELVDAQDYR